MTLRQCEPLTEINFSSRGSEAHVSKKCLLPHRGEQNKEGSAMPIESITHHTGLHVKVPFRPTKIHQGARHAVVLLGTGMNIIFPVYVSRRRDTRNFVSSLFVIHMVRM